ncbi:MAG: SynChlorMet cassette radical SAM/SPASM protein ScmF, partial [Candidatus Aminicenantes bacterium]|nr:SynChlorMet cassette radical SAM/SPASM protein ScmF [Candidatus Aminicenantes bacterium]
MAENRYRLNQVYFYLTEGCNLACRHCWLAPKFDSDGSHYPVLPLELFETAVREGKPLGLSGVKLTGGEPLLHPRFLDLIEIVRRENLRLTIETNGILCTPEMAAEIAKSPNRFVSVSLDGAEPAVHEAIRGVKGSFEASCAAVRNLAAQNIRPQVIMTVMRSNMDQSEAMIGLAEGLGAASVKFNIVQPTARGEKMHNAEETLSIKDLIALGRRVESELQPTTKMRLHFDYPQAFRSLSSLASGNGGTCGIMGIIGVIATGLYALCGIGEHIPEFVFGRVGEDRLADVWNDNPMLNAIRAGIPNKLEGVCGRCLMRRRCLASCVAQNYYR